MKLKITLKRLMLLRLKSEKILKVLLKNCSATLIQKLTGFGRGAKEAMASTNPDKKRHVVVSLREMLTYILHGIAPDNEVSKWTSKPVHFHEGRPTREARLLYVCRDINHGPFEQFVSKDVEAHIKFFHLFQRGTHELDINFTEQQLRTLVVRTEALARFLLITWKNTK